MLDKFYSMSVTYYKSSKNYQKNNWVVLINTLYFKMITVPVRIADRLVWDHKSIRQ